MHTNTTSPRRLALPLLLTLTLGGSASAFAADNPMGGMMQGMQGSDVASAPTAMMGDTTTRTAPQSGMLATDNDDDDDYGNPMAMMQRMRERVMGGNGDRAACLRERMMGNDDDNGGMGMMGRGPGGMGPMGMMRNMRGGMMGGMMGGNPMGADTMGGDGARLDRIERRLASMDALLRDMAYGR